MKWSDDHLILFHRTTSSSFVASVNIRQILSETYSKGQTKCKDRSVITLDDAERHELRNIFYDVDRFAREQTDRNPKIYFRFRTRLF